MAKNWFLSSVAAVVVAVGVVACGVGGGGSTTVGGLVAVGESLSNATVLLIDADGLTKQVTSDANGAYSINVTGMKAPFVIKAAGSIGTQEYNLVSMLASSTSGQNNAVQVTPLTTGIAALVNASNGYSADGLLPATVTPASVAVATKLLTTALSGPISAAGLSTSFNPVTDTFSADRTGHL
jgi:glucoamylase